MTIPQRLELWPKIQAACTKAGIQPPTLEQVLVRIADLKPVFIGLVTPSPTP